VTSSAPHFILAHGFTQTGRSWENVEGLLRTAIPGCRTTAVDLPGHGGATPSLATADLWRSADHLVERGGSGIYAGYSMGGRVALHAALAHPDAVEALVLIGATGGIDDPDERSKRRFADERLADRIEQIGVDDFLTEWLANPLFAGLTDETAQLTDRRRNTAVGLASSLRSTGTGTQQPLWNRLSEIVAPTLVIVGEHDAKFHQLGDRIVSAIPNSGLAVIDSAGHSAHLEHPAETVHAIVDWCATLGARP
jgi:2-succinyl-6-hydroxy-2,4-cyclohexadiene-1-carboxylate synthase